MPNRNETSTAAIYFYFKVGSKNETLDTNGISHFVEHMIYKGSPKFPEYINISKNLDANGIYFNAYTSKDITAYHFKFLSSPDNLNLVCNIASDMIMKPLMREKDIETERNVIIQEYNDDLDDIDEYIDDKIEENLLKGHPLSYPVIGTLKNLRKITQQQIVDYHKKYYSPDNLLIGYSGSMPANSISIINKYFGGANAFSNIRLDSQGISQIIPFVDKHDSPRIDCYDKDLNQDYIHIIFKTNGYFDPMKKYYMMLSNILGSNMSSRLFVEIREKLGLVYSVKTSLTNYEEVGYFDIYSQNESKDTVECMKAIFKELKKIKSSGVSNKELEENKKNYSDLFKGKFDDIEFENEYFAKQILFNRPIESVTEKIESINEIKTSDIKTAACELFDFNKIHIITFGKVNKKKLENVLKKCCL
jgi:predicted Zn-dependent peptidase